MLCIHTANALSSLTLLMNRVYVFGWEGGEATSHECERYRLSFFFFSNIILFQLERYFEKQNSNSMLQSIYFLISSSHGTVTVKIQRFCLRRIAKHMWKLVTIPIYFSLAKLLEANSADYDEKHTISWPADRYSTQQLKDPFWNGKHSQYSRKTKRKTQNTCKTQFLTILCPAHGPSTNTFTLTTTPCFHFYK